MSRPYTPGFVVASDAELLALDTIALPDNTPLLCHSRRAWGILTRGVSNLNSINGFEFIPQNTPNAYTITAITISTSSYTLDLSQVTQNIHVILNTNTTLTITNSGKYIKFNILIEFNRYTIKNFSELFDFPTAFFDARLITTNFGDTVLEVQYINKLFADIVYSENVRVTDGTVITDVRIPYTRPTPDLVFFQHNSSASTFSGTGITTVSTVGPPIIEKNRLLLSGGRLECAKHSSFNFNETDFTVSFVLQKKVLGDFGAIVSSHSSTSVGFYVGVTSSSLLTAVFGVNSMSYALPDDLGEHVVIINRMGKIYRLFLDGVLVGHVNAVSNTNPNSTEPFCIGSLKTSVGSPSWTATSFQGYLRDITVNLSATIPYSCVDVYARDVFASQTVLLLKYNVGEEDLAQYSLSRSFTSNVSTFPFLANGALNKYTHLGYSNINLEITGDCTLEATLINPAGNSRATIINSNGNFHWGIYDNNIRIDFGSFSLTGAITLPNDTEFTVAFSKVGTAVKLYVNGVIDVSATTSEVMNGAGASPEFSIKREASQDNSPASLNTTLYPSRSWLIIKQLRVTKAGRYNSDYLLPISLEQ